LDELDIKINLKLVGVFHKYNKYYNELTEVINNSKHNITVEMNLEPERMEDIYLNSDLFILPSYKEPAAYSVLEAMSYGLPVICSNDNGTSCYLDKEYVFKARDKNSLINVIKNTTIKEGKIDWAKLESVGNLNIFIVKSNHSHKNVI
jgi:glycosyltransferase involved in cell wall biosynthesis